MLYQELLKNPHLAITSFQNQAEFRFFEPEKKAELALTHPTLMLAIIAESTLSEADKSAIFHPIKDKNNVFGKFRYATAAYLSAQTNEAVALALFSKPELFATLNDSQKAELGVIYPKLGALMLASNTFAELNKKARSYFVVCSTLDRDEKSPNLLGPMNAIERDALAEVIFKNPHLRENIYPAARLFLVSRLIKMGKYEFSSHNSEYLEALARDLPLEFNKLGIWLYDIVANLSFCDYIGRFTSDVLRTALGQVPLFTADEERIYQDLPPNNSHDIQTEALAYAIITDERFVTGFEIPHYSDHPYAQLTLEHRFKLAMKYPRICQEIYINQNAVYRQFSPEQKSLLVAQHPDFMLLLINSADSMTEDEKKAIFSCFSSKKLKYLRSFPAVELTQHSGAFYAVQDNTELVFALHNRADLFNCFSDWDKIDLALKHPALAFKMLENGDLENWHKSSLSGFVTPHLLNPSQQKLQWWQVGTMREEDRNRMTLLIYKSPLFLNLYPITQILLLARLKNMLQSGVIQSTDLDTNSLQEIDSAYSLSIKYDGINFWLFSIADASSGANYWRMFEDVLRDAKGISVEFHTGNGSRIQKTNPQYAVQAEALAYALVADPRFINGLKHETVPNHYRGVLKTDYRVVLAKLYLRVALLVLQQGVHQGIIPLKLDQWEEIISTHQTCKEMGPYVTYYEVLKKEVAAERHSDVGLLCLLYDKGISIFTKKSESKKTEEKPEEEKSESKKPEKKPEKVVPRLKTLALQLTLNRQLPYQNAVPAEIEEEVMQFSQYSRSFRNWF